MASRSQPPPRHPDEHLTAESVILYYTTRGIGHALLPLGPMLWHCSRASTPQTVAVCVSLLLWRHGRLSTSVKSFVRAVCCS